MLFKQVRDRDVLSFSEEMWVRFSIVSSNWLAYKRMFCLDPVSIEIYGGSFLVYEDGVLEFLCAHQMAAID